MEIIQFYTLTASAVSSFTAWSLWIYNKGYEMGHVHGKHTGFSEGLFKAAERANKYLTRQ